MPRLTNATKAVLMTIVSAVVALLVTFGLALDPTQIGLITTIVDGLLLLYIAFTYKDSPKRVEDEAVAEAASEGRVEIVEDELTVP